MLGVVSVCLVGVGEKRRLACRRHLCRRCSRCCPRLGSSRLQRFLRLRRSLELSWRSSCRPLCVFARDENVSVWYGKTHRVTDLVGNLEVCLRVSSCRSSGMFQCSNAAILGRALQLEPGFVAMRSHCSLWHAVWGRKGKKLKPIGAYRALARVLRHTSGALASNLTYHIDFYESLAFPQGAG